MLTAIDFETYLISKEAPWPKPVCLSYKNKEHLNLAIGYDQMNEVLSEVIRGPGKVLAHNMAFEFNIIYLHFPHLRSYLFKKLARGELICTQIYQQLVDHNIEKPLRRYSLADLVLHYIGCDISAGKKGPDVWRLKYHTLDGVPRSEWPSEAVEYALSDSDYAYRVYLLQPKGYSYAESVASEALLNMMGKYGVLVDQEGVSTLKKELLAHLEPLRQTIIKAGFGHYQGKKFKKKMKLFQEYIKLKLGDQTNHTAKGAVSTKAEHLKQYYGLTKDKVIGAFLQMTDYENIISTFVTNLEQADPYIRSRYSAAKSSSRTSSSKDSLMPSQNIQQAPRSVPNVSVDVRNVHIPRNGYKIVSIDYAGLELASTAHQLYRLYHRSQMRDRINSGNVPVDMHSLFANSVRNKVLHKNDTYDHFVTHKKVKGYKEYRAMVKPISLGLPGGRGLDSIRREGLKDGLNLKFKIVSKANNPKILRAMLYKIKRECPDILNRMRIARLGKKVWAIVKDDLIGLKKELFNFYPELGLFLKSGHKRFLTGETRWKQDPKAFMDWVDEPMYKYESYGHKRNWCTYTALCNGYLMQTPSAIGAKRMMCRAIEKYHDDPRMNPLAFIHDEILFEVLICPEMYDIIKDVSEIMIDQMQTVLSSVRITVEASLMDRWSKDGGEWNQTYWKNYDSKELYSGTEN